MMSGTKMTGRKTIAVAAALLVFGSLNVAQGQFGRGGGGPRMAPEKAAAAQALEAKGVAHNLGLDDALAAKLAEAYTAARESQSAARQELFENAGGDRMSMMQGMADLTTSERGKLKTAIAAFLSEEQVGKAMPSLGSFNSQWDRFVDTLAGYGLEDAKQLDALTHIAAYVAEATAAREEAMANMDFQSIRSGTQAAKEKLDTALTGVLSAEQLTSWKEATAQRGRGGRGGGGGRRGGNQ